MRSKRKHKILNQIAVAKPCQAEDFDSIAEPRANGWYCNHCQKPVHDFTKLSKDEISDLIDRTGGQLCASIVRRPDGSMVTKEYPSTSLFSAGVIFAGTALLATSASAQTPAEQLKPPAMDQPSDNQPTPLRGEIAPIEGATPTCKGDTTKSDQPTAQPDKNPPKIDPNTVELGRISVVPQHTRGKVAIQKK